MTRVPPPRGEESDSTADGAAASAPPRLRRLPRPRLKHAVAVVVCLTGVALITACGWMVYQHHCVHTKLQRRNEYAAAASQSVITLMSIDQAHAQQDVQRIIDMSTGPFKEDFQRQAPDLVKAAQESHIVTTVAVNLAGVEEMSDNTATVLVSAMSRVTNTAASNQDPRSWRLAVDLRRDGNQIKVSKVEFVP